MNSSKARLAISGLAALALICVAAVLAGLSDKDGIPESQTSRIEVVVMENQNYGDVIGSADAPYTNRLARRYGVATRMFAATHPSLPNYLAMTAGTTYGVRSDDPPKLLEGANLMSQLSSAGLTWQAYFAKIPTPCFDGPKIKGYSEGLNPFMVEGRIVKNSASCANIVPMSRLSSELVSGTLPDLVWMSPSLTQDSHNSTVKTGDTYLSKLVPTLIPSLGPNGALIVVWDEGKATHGDSGPTSAGINGTKGGGHIPTIIVGPGVRPGATTSTPMTSYSVLRFIEHSFGLPYLRHAATASDAPLRSLFATPPSPNQAS